MSMDENYAELMERIGELNNRKQQAKGSKAELLKQMKEQFGIETLEEALKLLPKLENRYKRDEKKAQAKYESAIQNLPDESEEAGAEG